jgi:hypothetical protein
MSRIRLGALLQGEHLTRAGQHVGVDDIGFVLPADRPTQPSRVSRTHQTQLATGVGDCHSQRKPRHRRGFGDGDRTGIR